MFEHQPNLMALRGFTAAVCLTVLAGCGGGVKPGSNPDSVPGSTMDAPAAPTGLKAMPGNAQASLTWSTSTGAASYNIKRSTATGGPYAQVASTASPSYTDSTVKNGTAYFYVVEAANSAGESADSPQVAVTPTPPNPATTAPAVPAGLAATPGNSQVSLTWSASSGATSYHVKRATTNGGPYTQITAPTSGSYTDTSVTNGTNYYYVVSALDSAGESANTAQVSAVPVGPASGPAPTAFGTWTNVTPSNVNLTDPLDCSNFGTITVQTDPTHPSNLYTEFNCQGIWKSTDYGATWTGPINTGTNGAKAGDCAGGITIAPSSTASVPVIYEACIRGGGLGFWKSVDGGVSWTNYFVAPSGTSRQDYYPPVIDPYDERHLVMAGHEMNYLVESTDAGQTWTNINLDSGMLENGGTAGIFFINTGNSTTTRGTWLFLAQQGAGVGTWRTTNSGANWVHVDKNEHPHGASQIYQPDNNGVVYMAGAYSDLGWGVLRSSDYGQTWTHAGIAGNQTSVYGTSKNVYSMLSPFGGPAFELGAEPGTGNWAAPATPAALNVNANTAGGAAQFAVVNDGTHNILVGAMWNSGVWRYIEP
jgi:fibronectin type 3 domain-containing protein